jgi:hypothetical protein
MTRKPRPRRRYLTKRAAQLVTGAGSASADGLAAPEGFERWHVLDSEGRPSTVLRRVDNLARLKASLGADRVNALVALRSATEARERGIAPRSCLNVSPGAGPDGYLALMQQRLDFDNLCDQMWAAIPAECHGTVSAIVVHGWTISALARHRGGRLILQQQIVCRHLEAAADAINLLLDRRFGRASLRLA